jgi:hypothetical protein
MWLKKFKQYLLNTVPHKQEYIQASKDVLDIQVETINNKSGNTKR